MSILLQEQYIEIVLGKAHYALATQEVDKIIKMQTIFDVPDDNSYLRGFIYIRDKAIPVISLRGLFGMTDEVCTSATRIIIHKYRRESIGFIVDQVNKVSVYEDIQPVRDHVDSVKRAYCKGMTNRDGVLVGILNMNEIVTQA
ncbi:purine-binding chemotaxis protein CheW [Paenibacillus sp. 1_12]|uniref:chemotaxis protein CheW n=1 Tax=Paenibacillus sp. 1_12 TaxID=1566278 RepID=UPI0008E9E955|nr:chemotaxis protein CheW [Paenibacillus sp. 1_12]SFM06721.1 purine-binding chemotaxis protein CheW [Paenibacillus sp. 1_12]